MDLDIRDPLPAERARALAPWLGAAVAVMGGLVLVGWFAGLPWLTSALSGLSSMKANTALALGLAGAWLATGPGRRGASRAWTLGVPAAIIALGGVTLAEYAAGVDLIDNLLVKDTTPGPLNPFPGRMGANTAAAFLLLGGAMLLAGRPGVRAGWASQLLASGAGLIALLALIGYLYSAASLVRVGSFTPMALHTAAAFAILAAGLLLATPERGFMPVFSRGGPTGRHARLLLFFAFAIPIARGGLALLAESSGAVTDRRFADALSAAGAVTAFAVLLGWSAARLQRQEARLLETRVSLLTEQRHSAELDAAHRAAWESEARLQAILDHTPSVVYLRDPAGRYVLVNKAFEAHFGLGPAQVRGRTNAELFPGAEEPPWRANDERVLRARAPVTAEERVTRADGRVHTYLSVKFPIMDDAGEVALIGGISTDITEAKGAEATRRESERRAAELVRLQETDRFKTQFINHINHEMRTPLTPLRLQVGVLRLRGQDDPAVARSLDVMSRNMDRLEAVLQHVLEAAQLQGGTLGLHRGLGDLGPLVETVAATHAPLAAEAGVRLRWSAAAHLPVSMDRDRLAQALAAFVANAIKYTPRGGEVAVEAVREGDVAVVRVRDTGIGIRAEDLPRLFTAFTQVHDTAQDTRLGAGLGLYVAQGLVELHLGRVWAESPGRGRGATFGMALPRVEEPAPGPPAAATREAALAAATRAGHTQGTGEGLR